MLTIPVEVKGKIISIIPLNNEIYGIISACDLSELPPEFKQFDSIERCRACLVSISGEKWKVLATQLFSSVEDCESAIILAGEFATALSAEYLAACDKTLAH